VEPGKIAEAGQSLISVPCPGARTHHGAGSRRTRPPAPNRQNRRYWPAHASCPAAATQTARTSQAAGGLWCPSTGRTGGAGYPVKPAARPALHPQDVPARTEVGCGEQ
jgi:hypothetical protein